MNILIDAFQNMPITDLLNSLVVNDSIFYYCGCPLPDEVQKIVLEKLNNHFANQTAYITPQQSSYEINNNPNTITTQQITQQSSPSTPSRTTDISSYHEGNTIVTTPHPTVSHISQQSNCSIHSGSVSSYNETTNKQNLSHTPTNTYINNQNQSLLQQQSQAQQQSSQQTSPITPIPTYSNQLKKSNQINKYSSQDIKTNNKSLKASANAFIPGQK
jgi:D-ribose pyranose/furanose isomerase RbsD